MRRRGSIIDWNDEKGFGFVEYDKKRAFVHIKAFNNRKIRPMNGNTIFYELDNDSTGRMRAINIDIKQPKNAIILEKDIKNSSQDNFVPIIITIVFILYLIFLRHSIPLIIPYYFIFGFMTFYFYKIDKEAAEGKTWRTSEKKLLILGLIGGWIGAIIAQRILRHKTIKKQFQFGFWMTVIANCAGLFAYSQYLK